MQWQMLASAVGISYKLPSVKKQIYMHIISNDLYIKQQCL